MGTRVATRYSWTPVEDLSPGDAVLTAQDGEQVIRSIHVGALSLTNQRSASKKWPVQVPRHVLGNQCELVLAHNMWLIVEHPACQQLFDQPCVTVQAEHLIGFGGISRVYLSHALGHRTLEFDVPVSLTVENATFLDIPKRGVARRFLELDERQTRRLVRRMTDASVHGRAEPAAAG